MTQLGHIHDQYVTAYDKCEMPYFRPLWSSDYERLKAVRVFVLWEPATAHPHPRRFIPPRKRGHFRRYYAVEEPEIYVDRDMARLESLAKSGSESGFLDAVRAIDWQTRPASDYLRAVDLSLRAGAHLTARRLATEGAEIHFDSEELQKYARILAPPTVSNRRPSSNVSPKANVDWLKANRNEYRGKWVAIKDGTLLASGNSHEELIAQVGKTKGRGILITNLY